jgi:anti-sigma factor RsiW
MSDPEPTMNEHEAIEAELADYVEGSLSDKRAAEIEKHLAGCEECSASLEDVKEMITGLSGLGAHPAPQDFEHGVTETIRRRSKGTFFGRKAFGDRIPFELLAVFVLAVGLILFSMLRCSDTGSLEYDRGKSAPEAPGAKDVVPQP